MHWHLEQILTLLRITRDDPANAFKVITTAEHETHDGHAFMMHGTITTANADVHVTAITLRTPDDPSLRIHMFASASVTGAAWFYIYENPTITDNQGTSLLTAYNRKRENTYVSQIWESKSNPDTQGKAILWNNTDVTAQVTLGSTIIHGEQLAAGRNSFATTRDEGEIILNPNEDYAFVLENEGSTANLHNLNLSWYED